jgi:hypothetical protein
LETGSLFGVRRSRRPSSTIARASPPGAGSVDWRSTEFRNAIERFKAGVAEVD